MEIFFFDAGLVSIFAGRETERDWGLRTSGWNAEVWAGRTYICASFDKRKMKRAGRIAFLMLAAFLLGLAFDPPSFSFGDEEMQPAAVVETSRPHMYVILEEI